jgi:uncharacterized protein YyaL (SSP411 family)
MKYSYLLSLAMLGLITLTACGDDKTPATPKPATAPASEPNAKPAEHKHTNKLAGETSPYLLQHAHNPVNWHPWGKEAFEKAKKENKPIFLSVGYSTCYWCHVMERESFEQEEVAKVLNEHYVAIKVDREELPDIDQQYMLATQMITGRGGWPNSVWLTPEGTPWMAGTYFPKEQFITVLERMAELWSERRELVDAQAAQLAAAIRRNSSSLVGRLGQEELSRALVEPAFAAMRDSFDATHGGFGTAPKFPPHGQLSLLVQELAREPNKELEKILVTTLDRMWQGGIHDHVGGGFHRYATDAQWLLPHFEKMLYDNAQLMLLYADAYQVTGHERYRTAVADIYSWLEREMTHADGGFYSALDSESDGEEGRYYVWSIEELNEVLGAADAKLFAEVYQFSEEGNFEEERTGERTGHNIPHLNDSLAVIAEARKVPVDELTDKLKRIREKLQAARKDREYPHRDDKILTSWNGLMITALARAGQVLEEPKYTAAAKRAALFLQTRMWKEGTLLRTYRAGEAKIPGYLNDYAFFAQGLLELHASTGEDRWLELAQQLTVTMLERFEDTEAGGFFFASEEHEELITRSKNLQGGGNLPSGNGIAVQVLLQMAEATGEKQYAQAARKALDSFSGVIARAPLAAESLVVATADLLESNYAEAPAAEVPSQPVAFTKPVVTYERKPITARVYVKPLKDPSGVNARIEVVLEIDEGWHLYGPNKGSKFLIPTTVTVAELEGVTFGEISLPKAKKKEDPVLGETVEIYEKQAVFKLPVTIAEGVAIDDLVVKLSLRTQACDARRCLPPETKVLEVPLAVGEAK